MPALCNDDIYQKGDRLPFIKELEYHQFDVGSEKRKIFIQSTNPVYSQTC
jgi:hypothetical protein